MTHQFLSVMYQCQPCLLGDVTRDLSSALTCLASTALPICQYCIRHVTYYDAKLFECWPDVGPALKQHWVNVSCWLVSAPVINSRPNTATLSNCWASFVGGVPALKQRWLHVIVQRYACLPVWSVCPGGIHNNTQLTQGDVESMLVQRLSTIYDVGPTLSQLRFNVLSLLACQYTCMGPI